MNTDHLAKWFMKPLAQVQLRSPVSRFWVHAPAGASLLALIFALAPPAFAASQLSIPISYISSWDSHGFENVIYYDESRIPDHLAGKGPDGDRFDTSILKRSYNAFAFQIPQFTSTGVLASAELHLQVRYLVSTRGTEVYQCSAVTNPVVKLALHRRLPASVFYNDPDNSAVYGSGVISVLDSTATLGMDGDFLTKVTAAAGETLLVQGSLTSLDGDPYNPEYLYIDSGTLILTFADGAKPAISTQPLNRSVNAGTDVDFRVSVTGATPLSYQWSFNEMALNTATNPSLVLPGVVDEQAGNYRVIVSNSFGSVTSMVATLQVLHSAPFIILQPSGLTIAGGETNRPLRGMASGAPPPAYQWRYEGADIPGATNTFLSFASFTATSGHYSLFASNSSGSVTSNPALLTVVPFYLSGPSLSGNLLGNPISIWVTPYGNILPTNWLWFDNGMAVPGANNSLLNFIGAAESSGEYFAVGCNQYGCVTSSVVKLTIISQAPFFRSFLGGERVFVAGQTNSLDGTASAGPPATYQWYHDGVLIPGEQNPVLTLPNTLLSDAGHYSVVASNVVGMATNGPVLISVVPGFISINPSYTQIGVGYTMLYLPYYQGVFPVSYQWFYDGTPHSIPPTGTNSYLFNGTPLAGETNASLLLTDLTTNQSGYYAVAVSNFFGSVLSSPAQLLVYPYGPQASAGEMLTNRAGDFVWLTAYISGGPPPACQWRFNDVDIPGATNYILALSNVSTQQSGAYSVVASNTSGSVTSSYPTQLQIIAPTALDDWSSLSPDPQANPLSAVAYGNGRRVAVGENGAVVVSTDGQTWSGRHLGRGVHLQAVTFGNGMFVAVGHADVQYHDLPVILTSLDGVNWTAPHLTASGRLTGVGFGNGRFVIVGARDVFSSLNVALISSDGVNWENHYLPISMYWSPLSAISYGNSLFVAVSDLGSSSTPSIFYSPDGVNWHTGFANSNRDWEAVSAAGTSFVAAGDAGGIARSSDGVNWTVSPITYTVPFKAVSFGNGTYVAAGDSGATLYSNDGLSWHVATVPSVHDLSGLVFDGGQFTAVGDAGRILVSSNGQTWTDQCVGPDTDLYGIARGPNAFVAVGDSAIITSSDGTNWIQLNSSRKLHGVTYGNGLFVAVGKKGAILTSPDGLTWTTRSVTSDSYIERIIWANNRFVGVGEAGLMVTSTDGISWSILPPVTASDLEGIAYGNGTYVAVGGYFPFGDAEATVLTSSDGVHWIDQPSVAFFGVRARAVTFANGVFVMVGNDGLTAISSAGISWLDHFFYYDNFRSVTYAAGYFVAVGNDGLVMSSLNGSDWVVNRCPASMNLRDVMPMPGALLAVGSNGAIWQSGELRPLVRARLLPEGFEMNVSGGLAPQCRLQASTNFWDWTDLFIYTNSAPANFLDSAAHGMPNRFYRLIPR